MTPIAFLRGARRRPLLDIIHAYFDESGKKSEHPVVAFCGMVIREAKLDDFNAEWRGLLRRFGWPSLHMKKIMTRAKFSHNVEAKSPTQRANALRPFADCINQHLELGIIQALDVQGFLDMPKGMRAGLGSPTDPGYVAFVRALLELMDHCQSDDRVALICDHDDETATDFFRHYKGVRRAFPAIMKMTISLAFADDNYFPSLQAADMVAFMSRHEAKRQFYGARNDYKPLLDYMVDYKPKDFPMEWRVGFWSRDFLRSLKTPEDVRRETAERIRALEEKLAI